jgi:ABC-2 type transport system ATP-binding protein
VVIKIENLGKIYTSYRGFLKKREILALKNFDLEVKRGEIFGLLGLNAAGKTTVLKILLGFVHPTWGRFEILGKNKLNSSVRAKLGYLPEEPRLYEFLSAEEFLVFCGKLFGLNKSERIERAGRLIKLMQIRSVSQTKIGEFSKGMNQRLAIASALINEPEILFLDEPLSGLDPVGRKIVKEIIFNFAKEGRTVFFSSHILAEVEEMSDRIGILHEGKLLCVEEVKSILSRFSSLERFFLTRIGIELQ